MQQPTIFDENFELNTIKHRRFLLPTWVKIYCWITMISGLAISTGISLYLWYILENYALTLDVNPQYKLFFFIEYSYLILLGLIIFLIPLLLWLGKKSAIRLNWILSALCILPVIALLFRNSTELSSTLPIFLLLPLWIALPFIQKKWETTEALTIPQ